MNATEKQIELIVNIITRGVSTYKAFDQIVKAHAGEGNYYFIEAQKRIGEKLKKMSKSQADYFIRAFYSGERSYRKSKAMNILVSYKLI